jgi:hypothetical protein
MRGESKFSKMRKLIPITVALVLGAGIGLGSFEVWVHARTLPYCKVANNADSYHMRFVRVKARIHFGTGGVYIYEDCDPVEALAASVELEGDRAASGIGYVNELLVSGGESHVKVADAIIEGEFDAHASPGCWSPKFHIAARKIELISSVSDYVPPAIDGDGPALRVKH